MSAPARCSADWANEIFMNALKRCKAIIDEQVRTIAASGRPPMTLVVTLADLKKMPVDDAVNYLKGELQRTMAVDPLTGDKTKPHPKTVDLALRYREWQEGLRG